MSAVCCVNLCETLSLSNRRTDTLEEIVARTCNQACFTECSRLYVGSYFCSYYFLSLNDTFFDEMLQFCLAYEVKITLVIPIFTPSDLERGKARIVHLITDYADCIDEVTVNDYGMLTFLKDYEIIRISLGRLFMKDSRDPRYRDCFFTASSPQIFSSQLDSLIEQYDIAGMEFDPTHYLLDFSHNTSDLTIAIHLPYCFMSTGHICEFASRNLSADTKFRPNQPCARECLETHNRYRTESGANLIKFGRSVYYENPACLASNLENYRIVFATEFRSECAR